MDEDTQEAAEHQRMLEEQRQREDELLLRSPAAHRELQRIAHETTETCKALDWAIRRIFHP